MAETFDPYHKWLGIPPEEQPPNHYRLLGIRLFESDPDVIANAADQRMTHVRAFQSGQHSAISQEILDEISKARVFLLDPKRKADYDEGLRLGLAAVESQPRASELRESAQGTRKTGESPILFECARCGRRLRARRSQAGRRFACPSCSCTVTVPPPEETHKPPIPPPKFVEPPSLAVELPPVQGEPQATSEAVACPHCSEPLVWDSLLAGAAASCPRCGGVFQMPAGAPPPPTVIQENRHRTRSLPEDSRKEQPGSENPTRMMVAVIGSVLLFGGCFVPIEKAPLISFEYCDVFSGLFRGIGVAEAIRLDKQSAKRENQPVPRDKDTTLERAAVCGILLVAAFGIPALAILSFVFALQTAWRGLCFTAGCSAGLVALTFVAFEYFIGRTIGEVAAESPVAAAAGQLLISPSWGYAVLVAGIALLLAAAWYPVRTGTGE